MASAKKDRHRVAAKGFLEPITGTVKRRPFCTFDIESKDEDTQRPGFTRPFLVGLFDPRRVKEPGEGYLELRDEPHLQSRDWRRRHVEPGGCIDKLLSVILTKAYAGCIFYSHNGGNFDMLFLTTWLQEHRDEFGFEVVPIQSTIQVLRVWRVPESPDDPVRERWDFLDSMRLIPMGLAKACKTFGIEEDKSKIKFDLGTHEDDPNWSRYLKQDCIALAAVMSMLYNMVEDRLGGEVGVTTPATAMKLFRRRYLGRDGTPERIARWQHWRGCGGEYDGTCTGCAHEWIRRGYYGGRTEIFHTSGTRLHYFDLNSSYVAAMHEDMPIGQRIVEETLDWRRHRSAENPSGHYSGFCECTVYIPPDCPIPPLPHRDERTGKLQFPTGILTGVWSVEELALLSDPLVGGHIKSVVKTVWFKLEPMFGTMVRDLWKLRDTTLEGFDEGLSALAKLLGNSTYGKFAMKQERSMLVFTRDDEPNEEGLITRCFLCGEDLRGRQGICAGCEGSRPAMPEPDGDVWYQAKHVDASYIIPHVAAHITALARVNLWRYMKMAIEMGGKVYYTDTDSIITDVMLPTSPALGALKDEYPGEELDFVAVQPKVYMIEPMKKNAKYKNERELLELSRYEHGPGFHVDASTLDNDPLERISKVTMKGFPMRIRTRENLERLRAGETLAWEQLEKVRSLARTGFRRPPKMKSVTKSFQSSYDKRILLEDGSTRSVVIGMPEEDAT